MRARTKQRHEGTQARRHIRTWGTYGTKEREARNLAYSINTTFLILFHLIPKIASLSKSSFALFSASLLRIKTVLMMLFLGIFSKIQFLFIIDIFWIFSGPCYILPSLRHHLQRKIEKWLYCQSRNSGISQFTYGPLIANILLSKQQITVNLIIIAKLLIDCLISLNRCVRSIYVKV